MYVNNVTGLAVTLTDIKKALPNVSLGTSPSSQTLAGLGYSKIVQTPRPDGDVITAGTPEKYEGIWRQSWHVRSFTDDEIREQRRALLPMLEDARKDAEAIGVTINGIRYSGDPSNRAALMEVVQFAREAGQKEFQSWKDSDGQFHPNHPLDDVEQALHAIALRRGALIALEGQYQAKVVAGEIDSVEGLSWEV